MEKFIQRRFGFNKNDVYAAILRSMKQDDLPMPSAASKPTFTLTDGGATLEWSEESES